MIIRISDYRKPPAAANTRTCESPQIVGNTLRLPKVRPQPLATADATGHELPEDFRNFNAKSFIENAYGLATQI